MRESCGPNLTHDQQVLDLCLATAKYAARRMALRQLLESAEGDHRALVVDELAAVDQIVADLEQRLRLTID